MMRALVVLLKSSLLTEGALELQHKDALATLNPSVSCKVLIVVWQYFILANYSWILMEGLYLHNLIFMAVFSDSSAITTYIILGWGLPFVCVGTWATLRAILDDSRCWTVHEVQWIFWLSIRIPVALSNVVNFIFFLNVTRVLLLKLRSSISPESMNYRKLGKSTLVLAPLFGIHYFLLWGLSASSDVTIELVWLFLDQVFASFQGFFVAVLYCLMNGEVRQEMRKVYYRLSNTDPPLTSHSTVVTKTYLSRGRTSMHSIHSVGDKRDRGSLSPQQQRSNTGSPSSQAPLQGSPSLSPPTSPTPLLNNQYCAQSAQEAIELQSITDPVWENRPEAETPESMTLLLVEDSTSQDFSLRRPNGTSPCLLPGKVAASNLSSENVATTVLSQYPSRPDCTTACVKENLLFFAPNINQCATNIVSAVPHNGDIKIEPLLIQVSVNPDASPSAMTTNIRLVKSGSQHETFF